MFFYLIRKIGLRPAMIKLYTRVFHHDKLIDSFCDRVGAGLYLSKYKRIIDSFPREKCIEWLHNTSDMAVPKRIWLSWLQGYDNAPEIVKRCRESIYHFAPDFEIIEIDESNVRDYIDIPECIDTKKKRGGLPYAHYSDYIRISLVEKYGGIWLDATIMLSGGLPKYVTHASLFKYRSIPIAYVCNSIWVISAQPQCPILTQWLRMFEAYWANEKHLVSYSISMIMWTMIVNSTPENVEIWNRVPFFSSDDCYHVQREWGGVVSAKRLEQIKKVSSVHKLTYKVSPAFEKKEGILYKAVLDGVLYK